VIAFLDRRDLRDRAFHEATIIAHLRDYQRRQTPAAPPSYPRLTLRRRFSRQPSLADSRPVPRTGAARQTASKPTG
jgi:hypothetical protein